MPLSLQPLIAYGILSKDKTLCDFFPIYIGMTIADVIVQVFYLY